MIQGLATDYALIAQYCYNKRLLLPRWLAWGEYRADKSLLKVFSELGCLNRIARTGVWIQMSKNCKLDTVIRFNPFVNGVFCGVLLLLSSLAVQAQDGKVELTEAQRLARLERLLSSDNLRQQTQTIKALKEEISSLREQVEQQSNELNSLRQRQRSLYQDMDRRINNMEMRGGSSTIAAPVPPPTSSSASSVNSRQDGDGKEAYAVAFGLLKEGKYAQSITEFETFIKTYPDSKYADNAQYWLGEANYVSREYKKALSDFERLIAQFPDSTKIPGARLKIGYVYFELKNWSAAKDALQAVVKLYPDTTVAKKAKERLGRIKREGH